MRCNRRIVSSIIVSSIIPAAAHAGAWTQKQGHGQLIINSGYYRTETRYDNNGRRQRQPAYTKYEFNPYGEYGINDWLTGGASLFLQHADDSGRSRLAVGDSEFFARARLWQYERAVVSVQPLLKLPSPSSNNRAPIIGSKHPDAGLSLLAGTGFHAFGYDHYLDAAAGYRHRFGVPADQINLSATAGLRVSEHLTLMPQLFQTYRLNERANAAFTLSPGDDYNLTKAQISALWQIDERNAIQAGVFKHLAGDNTGAGAGTLVSYWWSF